MEIFAYVQWTSKILLLGISAASFVNHLINIFIICWMVETENCLFKNFSHNIA